MYKSGEVVQCVKGNENERGTLWIVEKHIQYVVLVYSMGKTVRAHFHQNDLALIGKAQLVIPAMHEYEK